jgi:hypothetical protein
MLRGTPARLVRDRTGAVVQVRSSEMERNAVGLRQAAAAIGRLCARPDQVPYLAEGEDAAPNMVSSVIPTPAGPTATGAGAVSPIDESSSDGPPDVTSLR